MDLRTCELELIKTHTNNNLFYLYLLRNQLLLTTNGMKNSN